MAMSEKRLEHIREMEEKILKLSGGQAEIGFSPLCPESVHEKFLEHILAFEESEKGTLYDELAKGGLQLSPPEELAEEHLVSKLWEVIRGMALLGAYLHNTNHLSDRELYDRLWREILPESTVVMPMNPGFAQHIDMIGSGCEEDIKLFLKYYADEDDRLDWARRWPKDDMPKHEGFPYDRDAALPRAPF